MASNLDEIGKINRTNEYSTWKIDKFFSLPLTVGREIRSPEFVYRGCRYALVIWPRGLKGSGEEEWFGICLYRNASPRSGGSVQFSIYSALGDIKKCTVHCSESNIFWQPNFIEWSVFCELSHKILPDGCLTIVCRLPNEKCVKESIQNDGFGSTFSPPLNDPPIKYQSDDHHPAESETVKSSSKLKSPEGQAACIKTPGYNCGHPSTINSFFKGSSLENSHELLPESIETQISGFKKPYNVEDTTSGNSFWSNFTRGFSRASKTDMPETAIDPIDELNQNLTSESVHGSAIIPPKAAAPLKTIEPLDTNTSEINLVSDSETTNSNFPLLKSQKECSSSVSQTVQSESFVSTSDGMTGVSNSSNRPNQPGEYFLSAVHYPKGVKILIQHLKNLYLNGKEFDVTIVMGGREFKVLKGLLKNRSPAFVKILSEDNCRNNNDIIPINSFGYCDAPVFHDFLLYIYTGEIENVSYKNIFGLYHAACKFEMPYLKEECISIFKVSLSVDTISDVCHMLNEEPELVNESILFLARNMEVILPTDKWKQFTSDEPGLAISFILRAQNIGYKKVIV